MVSFFANISRYSIYSPEVVVMENKASNIKRRVSKLKEKLIERRLIDFNRTELEELQDIIGVGTNNTEWWIDLPNMRCVSILNELSNSYSKIFVDRLLEKLK